MQDMLDYYAADSAQYLDGYREGSKEVVRRILAIINLEFMRGEMTNETYKNLQEGILQVGKDLNDRREDYELSNSSGNLACNWVLPSGNSVLSKN